MILFGVHEYHIAAEYHSGAMEPPSMDGKKIHVYDFLSFISSRYGPYNIQYVHASAALAPPPLILMFHKFLVGFMYIRRKGFKFNIHCLFFFFNCTFALGTSLSPQIFYEKK